jgi:hypothetical protein
MLQIKDLKDLGKLIDLCRKKGVETIKVDGIEFNLGEIPEAPSARTEDTIPMAPEAYIPITPNVTMAIASEELSEEDLLFYSAGSNQE